MATTVLEKIYIKLLATKLAEYIKGTPEEVQSMTEHPAHGYMIMLHTTNNRKITIQLGISNHVIIMIPLSYVKDKPEIGKFMKDFGFVQKSEEMNVVVLRQMDTYDVMASFHVTKDMLLEPENLSKMV